MPGDGGGAAGNAERAARREAAAAAALARAGRVPLAEVGEQAPPATSAECANQDGAKATPVAVSAPAVAAPAKAAASSASSTKPESSKARRQAAIFWTRLRQLHTAWIAANGAGALSQLGCGLLAVIGGKFNGAGSSSGGGGGESRGNGGSPTAKRRCAASSAPLPVDLPPTPAAIFQLWLFGGLSFSGTAVFLQHDRVTIMSSARKLDFLRANLLSSTGAGAMPFLRIDFCERNEAIMTAIVGRAAKKSGGSPDKFRVAELVCAGDELETGWRRALSGRGIAVDLAPGLAELLLLKDKEGIRAASSACAAAAACVKHMGQYLVDCYDSGQEVTRGDLEGCLREALPRGTTLCYAPVIEHGCFSLRARDAGVDAAAAQARADVDRPSGEATVVPPELVVLSVGTRHNGLCATVSRTLLFEPPPLLRSAHTFLESRLLPSTLARLQEGVRACDLYASVLALVEKEKPDLAPHFVRSIGHSIGYAFKEKGLVIRPKCTAEFRAGMVVSLNLGFAGLESRPNASSGSLAALVVGETVLVRAREATVLHKPKADALAWRVMRPPNWQSANSLLPVEILQEIFSYLTIQDLGRACQVCRLWRQIPWREVDFSRGSWRPRLAQPMFMAAEMIKPTAGHAGYNRFMGNMPQIPPANDATIRTVPLLRCLTAPRCLSLRLLDLHMCKDINEGDFHLLGSFTKMVELGLSYIGFKNAPRTCATLAEVLPRLEHLRKVKLAGNNLRHNSMGAIRTLLAAKSGIESLDLRDNPMMDIGAALLAKGLRENSALKRLYLGWPGSTSADMFAELLLSHVGVAQLRTAAADRGDLDIIGLPSRAPAGPAAAPNADAWDDDEEEQAH